MDSNRPEPVLDQARIAGTVNGVATGLGGILVTVGAASADDVTATQTALVAALSALVTLVNVVVPILRARVARGQVTPLASPQTTNGVPLVPTTAL